MLVGEYEILDITLGGGNQGSIVNAIHTPTGEMFAAKVTPFDTETRVKQFCNEIDILKQLKGTPGTVQLQQTIIRNEFGVTILEKMDGDLMTLLERNCLSAAQRRDLFVKICIALREVHQKNIVHLDIKPENILVSADLSQVKLCDFGFAKLVENQKVRSHAGTFYYSAPEVYGAAMYNGFKADIWSLGILYHVLLCDLWPFVGTNGNIEKVIKNGDVTICHDIKPQDAKLLSLMLRLDPETRMDLQSVIAEVERSGSLIRFAAKKQRSIRRLLKRALSL